MIFDKIATVETAFGTYKVFSEMGYKYLDRHQLVTYNDTLVAIYLPPDSTIPAVYFNMELEAHEDYFTEEEMDSTDWDKALARRQSMPVSGY